MQFLFPLFLFAAAAVAAPIIIHLFYFRRFKRVYFTNVRFLKEVKEESSSRRKLRNLLVLLMRCLAILFLVLAFAQPFIPKSNAVKRGDQAVSVYIDNSFSMAALAKEAPLLERAKQRAREIVQAYAISDRFQILTNDFEGRDQRLISQEDALNRIEEIKISPASRELSKVLTRQKQCLQTGKAANQTAFLISDFQASIADLSIFKDTTLEVQLAPMRAVQENNISIDSAWFDSPVQILNQPARLFVRISNRSDEDSEDIRLSFRYDGQTKPVGALRVPARASRVDTVDFNILRTGWHEARLSVSDYPVQFDDDYYLAFQVAEQINVLSINGSQTNKYLNKAFAGAPYFNLEQADARALDYSRFPEYQLIILNELPALASGLAQELTNFAQNGGNILVFPAKNAAPGAYDPFLQAFNAGPLGAFDAVARQSGQINTEEFIFRDVYLNKSANLRLPGTQGNFKLPANKGEPILTYRDGALLMAKYPLGDGALYLYAAPLDEQYSDLVLNGEIFVPMLFKMAVAGAKAGSVAYTIGKNEVLEAKHLVSPGGETLYKLRQSSEKNNSNDLAAVEFIPEQRILGSKVLLTPGKQVHSAGWYRLSLKTDSTLAEYAFNYDRKESDLRYRSDEELETELGPKMKLLSENAEANFTQVVDEQNQGIVLWRWCLLFALLFLALELLFLRLWKV
jgi:hypothetical protein